MKKLSAATVIVLAAVGLLGVVVGQAQAVPLWGPVTPVVFEAGVEASTPSTFPSTVSCASAGNCTAVGFFLDSDDATDAFAQTQTDGVWATAVVFKAGVLADGGEVSLSAVSCASAGNCTAVGRFRDGDGSHQAFALTQTDGAWGAAVPTVFAGGVQSNTPDAIVNSVSCASPGNCTAVGNFKDGDGYYEAFAWTQTDGTWEQAVPTIISVETTHHAARNDMLVSVSCASAGNCTAVGKYRVGYATYLPYSQTQTDGVWSAADPVQLTGLAVDLDAGGSEPKQVSCASAGNCTVVGTYYIDGGDFDAFMATQTDGVWDPAVAPAFPTGDYGLSQLRAVSCVGAGDCTVVGSAQVAGVSRGFAMAQTGGTWGEVVVMPDDVLNSPQPRPTFTSVSCASAGNCTAGGSFNDPDGNARALTWTQADGIWGAAEPVSLADGTRNAVSDEEVSDVSCASAGNCTAVGYFYDVDTGYQGFSQTLANGVAPTNAGGANAPTITGTAMVGETLTAGHGTWSNPPASENLYGYLWEVSANGTNGWAPITVADPNLQTLVVPAAYEGKYLRVTVVAFGDLTSEPAYSAVTARITGRGSPSAPTTEPSPITPRVASAAVAEVYSPAPGITVGATRGAVGMAASARAACRDLVRGASFWVRSTSKVTCLKSSLPAALSLRNGLVQAATPGTYPIRVRVSRANGTKVIRAITITVV